MKLLSVVGTRPQFVKLAPVVAATERRGVDHVVVDTGQHYDSALSSELIEDFNLPAPQYGLGVGSQSHPRQTAAILTALEDVLFSESPDWVIVYGDTNSTLAGSIAASQVGVGLCHLEAGLRSFNRSMPEERNRVVVDHLSDLLLAPTQIALDNLSAEGLSSRANVTGDVMVDICLRVAAQVSARPPRSLPGDPGSYVLATLHRPYNTDDPARLEKIFDSLADFPVPVVIPTHPRLLARAKGFGLNLRKGSLRPIEPLLYSELIYYVMNSAAVVTDSGGLQKEAYVLGKVCTTLRSETEWVETLQGGWNELLFDTANFGKLPDVALRDSPSERRGYPFGQGRAAEEAIGAILGA